MRNPKLFFAGSLLQSSSVSKEMFKKYKLTNKCRHVPERLSCMYSKADTLLFGDPVRDFTVTV